MEIDFEDLKEACRYKKGLMCFFADNDTCITEDKCPLAKVKENPFIPKDYKIKD